MGDFKQHKNGLFGSQEGAVQGQRSDVGQQRQPWMSPSNDPMQLTIGALLSTLGSPLPATAAGSFARPTGPGAKPSLAELLGTAGGPMGGR